MFTDYILLKNPLATIKIVPNLPQPVIQASCSSLKGIRILTLLFFVSKSAIQILHQAFLTGNFITHSYPNSNKRKL